MSRSTFIVRTAFCQEVLLPTHVPRSDVFMTQRTAIGNSDWLYRIASLFFDVVVVFLQVHRFLASVAEFVIVFAGAFVDQMVVQLVDFHYLFASGA